MFVCSVSVLSLTDAACQLMQLIDSDGDGL